MHVKVFKVGVQTGLTEGTVKFVDKNLLMVQGDNETVFAKPGDSGSLVFIKHEGCNIVVGIVARVNDGFSHTLVKGVWLFYDKLMETNDMY